MLLLLLLQSGKDDVFRTSVYCFCVWGGKWQDESVLHQFINNPKRWNMWLPSLCVFFFIVLLRCRLSAQPHGSERERGEKKHTPTPNSTVTQQNFTNMALKAWRRKRLVTFLLDLRSSSAVRLGETSIRNIRRVRTAVCTCYTWWEAWRTTDGSCALISDVLPGMLGCVGDWGGGGRLVLVLVPGGAGWWSSSSGHAFSSGQWCWRPTRWTSSAWPQSSEIPPGASGCPPKAAWSEPEASTSPLAPVGTQHT